MDDTDNVVSRMATRSRSSRVRGSCAHGLVPAAQSELRDHLLCLLELKEE